MRRIVLLWLLAGCDRLFGLQHINERAMLGDAATDTRGDASRVGDAPGDAITPTDSSCPTGFAQPYATSTYRYYNIALGWHDAQAFCVALKPPTSTKHVHLVVLTGDTEKAHVYTNVVGSAGSSWIGLSDTVTQNAFQWVSSEQLPYPGLNGPWAAGEPSTAAGDDCVRMLESNTNLDALPCSTSTPYVCECDDFANEPTHYD